MSHEEVVLAYKEKYSAIPELAERIVSQLNQDALTKNIDIPSFNSWSSTKEGSAFWMAIYSLEQMQQLSLASYKGACWEYLDQEVQSDKTLGVIRSMGLPTDNLIKVKFWANLPDYREEIVLVDVSNMLKLVKFPELAKHAAIRRKFNEWLMKQTDSCGYTEEGASEGFAFSSGGHLHHIKSDKINGK